MKRILAFLLVYGCSLYTFHDSAMASDDEIEPIVIAVIDDGFNTKHQLFNGMLWRNMQEQPNNGVDDDANGFTDDLVGWDVSDQDANLLPLESRLVDLDHGTFMAGIIAKTVRDNLGEMADFPVKLMFIKAVSDQSQTNTVEDGYRGIEYAINAGADIINVSWSGGRNTKEAASVLAKAQSKGIFIAGSMGNFYQEDPVFPISHPAVFGVAGVSSSGISSGGNLGQEADIAAIADIVESASARSDSAYREGDGTSNATAFVSATVALMKLANPKASVVELRSCLQSRSSPIDDINSDFSGKLGSGKLNIVASIECISASNTVQAVLAQPKGVLLYNNDQRKKSSVSWHLKPEGEYHGIELKPIYEGKNAQVKLKIVANNATKDLIWLGNAVDLPSDLSAPVNEVTIELSSKSKKSFKFALEYSFEPVNIAKKYCQGRTEIITELTLSDGSATNDYSNLSNCEWLVTPPQGHNVALTFTKVDTQLHTDVIHLFAGSERLIKNLLLKLSGTEVPQTLMISDSVPALLWFVSDAAAVGSGFEVDITFVPN